ncbi:hypothetical protein VitviT2T_019584 [Vitis vinifera]|uniref:Uncharacterized protein n=1 Tax=Vitis vinifera TaxID=29760 RepID=A0ABY9D1G9_VITVI|nr:hypothetical protein VitviT2T_019584 [Vitis vinifera]
MHELIMLTTSTSISFFFLFISTSTFLSFSNTEASTITTIPASLSFRPYYRAPERYLHFALTMGHQLRRQHRVKVESMAGTCVSLWANMPSPSSGQSPGPTPPPSANTTAPSPFSPPLLVSVS